MERQLAAASATHGNASDELEHLRKAVTLDPANAAAAAALQEAGARQVAVKVKAAEMLQRNGKGDDALTALSEARVLNDNHPDVTRLEQSINAQLRKAFETKLALAQYDDAVKDLQKLAEVDAAVSVEDEVAKDPGLRRHRARTLIESWGLYLGEILLVATLGIWVLLRIGKRYLSRPLLELNTFDNSMSAQDSSTRSWPGFGIVARRRTGRGGIAHCDAASRRHEAAGRGHQRDVTFMGVGEGGTRAHRVGVPKKAFAYPRRAAQGFRARQWGGVEVVTRAGDSSSETFWAKDYGLDAQEGDKAQDETHYPLAEYVAIWLLFQLSTKELRLLGTHRWQSFAFFRAGVRAEHSNKRVLAKEFFLKSLRIDDNLHAARLNLALLAEGSDRLLVVDMLRRAAAFSERTDATRYHARYALAARQFDREETDEALAEATALLADIATTCRQYGFYDLWMTALKGTHHAPPNQSSFADYVTVLYMRANSAFLKSRFHQRLERPHSELENYLGYLLPVLRGMWAGIRFSECADDQNAIEVLSEIAGADHSYRTLYNLACVYSLRAGSLPAAQVDLRVAYLRLSLDKLQRALWLNSAIGRYAPVHDRWLACATAMTLSIARLRRSISRSS